MFYLLNEFGPIIVACSDSRLARFNEKLIRGRGNFFSSKYSLEIYANKKPQSVKDCGFLSFTFSDILSQEIYLSKDLLIFTVTKGCFYPEYIYILFGF